MLTNDISKKHPLLFLGNELNQIILPLKSLGFDHFGYQKLYDDGTYVDIDDIPGLLEYFFVTLQGHRSMNFEKLYNKADGFEFSLSAEDRGYAAMKVREKFDLSHVLNFYQSSQSGVECFQFTASKKENGQNFRYLNNLEYLRKFIYYFTEKAASLLREAEKHKIKVCDKLTRNHNERLTTPIKNLKIKRYGLGKNYGYNHLTQREVECLYWLGLGKSSYEIARIIGTSKYTVNHHIENCKFKLQCYKQTQLITKCIKLGIIEIW